MAASSACFSMNATPARALRPRVRRVASSAGASRVARASAEGAVPEGSKVLVVGATGGVGQLVVAKLLEAVPATARAAGRSAERARATFGDGSPNGSDGRLEIVSADLRDVDGLLASNICRDVDAIVSLRRHDRVPLRAVAGRERPGTDGFVSVRNLVDCVKRQSSETCARFVLVSSVGVDRQDQMPFLDSGSVRRVATQKAHGRRRGDRVGNAVYHLTAGSLTDGPYTSYDINTLVKATSVASVEPWRWRRAIR